MGGRSRLRLTDELVAKVPPWREEESIGQMPEGARFAVDSDHDAIVDDLMNGSGGDEVWVFAYGSLIWNPGFEFVEKRTALAQGWHRSFCLGWDLWYRGSPARPGLMLALDRGGSCNGVAFRLPPGATRENLGALSRREVHILPHPFPPRWIHLVTDSGPLRAVAFVIDRTSDSYLGSRPQEEIADILAVAAGRTGSMAEYLFHTVRRLEEMGLRDRRLWRLQGMVARRIEQAAARV